MTKYKEFSVVLSEIIVYGPNLFSFICKANARKNASEKIIFNNLDLFIIFPYISYFTCYNKVPVKLFSVY